MTINSFQIESDCLGERRGVTIFLPRNCLPTSTCPIVFCTDGQAVEAFSHRIERDINDRKLPPLVLVGAHSSQRRSQEYTFGQDDSRFRLHEHFFTKELPDWLNATFNLKADRNRTAVFGFSHGGAFALTMASRHSDLFSVVIAFSTAGAFEEYQVTEHTTGPNPRFYLSAGSREKPLLKTTRRFAKHLDRSKVDCVVTERHAGHDFTYWETELPQALKWAFAADRCAMNNDEIG